MNNELLTVEELSDILKISRTTIDRWRKEGMPFMKIGRGIRFEFEDVKRWLDNNKGK
jgi:DNA binding domain, excisionase family